MEAIIVVNKGKDANWLDMKRKKIGLGTTSWDRALAL
jgi:hypothetical protein